MVIKKTPNKAFSSEKTAEKLIKDVKFALIVERIMKKCIISNKAYFTKAF